MKGYKTAGIKAAAAVCFTALFSLLLIIGFALVNEGAFDESVIFFTALAFTLSAVLAACIAWFAFKREYRFFSSLVNINDNLVYLRYDLAKKTAYIHGDISSVTGVQVTAGVIKTNEYETLLANLRLFKHDFEEETYSANDGVSWYKLAEFVTNRDKCTLVIDVTDYIERTSLINSLRYYDSVTGIFNKQSLTDILKRSAEHNKSLGLLHIVITGMERVTTFEGAAAADSAITQIAGAVKTFEDPHSTYAGRTSSNEITIVLTNINATRADYTAEIERITSKLEETAALLPDNVKQHITLRFGYAIFEALETEAEKMMAAAEFAAFDAVKRDSAAPVEYDPLSYAKSEDEFNKIRIFEEIVENNMLDYYFQPIVNARSGDIYGYEALMRPQDVSGVKFTPAEFLEIARTRNLLEHVEFLTLNNTLKILSDNQEVFRDKRIFINSVSSVLLTDNEYETLVDNYGELFSKLVIEVTEANKIASDILRVLDKYFRNYRAHVALDDYGSGYSNEHTLLEIIPNYIKIDRSLIKGIDSDSQKQQLVSNIISFATNHMVYSLAEGVETKEELETVIFLGVDLIQGYITCRPVPIFLRDLASDIKNLIVNYSVMHAKSSDSIFEVKDDQPVDLINLAVFGYTDIVIKTKNANFYGEEGTSLNMRIICHDDCPVRNITLKDVNMHHDELPVLTIGEHSDVAVVLVGENTMSSQGIRVPYSSRLLLKGDGNLNIDCSHIDSVCLGGNSSQTFGEIVIESSGGINLANKCDRCVCIGGGIGNQESVIQINSGRITINSRGVDALGIGAIEGNISVKLNSCYIEGDISGNNVVGIGSVYGTADIRTSAGISLTGAGDYCCLIGTLTGDFTKVRLNRGDIKIDISGSNSVGIGAASGRADINSNADVTMTSAGDNCCLIGTLTGRDSNIRINDGDVKITVNAKNIVGIGSLKGSAEITLTSGVFDIIAEGSNAVCIGSPEGGGDVRFSSVVVNCVSNSATQRNITANVGKIIISSGNIYTNSVLPIEAYGPGGSKLVCFYSAAAADGKVEEIKVFDQNTVYRYTVKPSALFSGYYTYLPENFEAAGFARG